MGCAYSESEAPRQGKSIGATKAHRQERLCYGRRQRSGVRDEDTAGWKSGTGLLRLPDCSVEGWAESSRRGVHSENNEKSIGEFAGARN
jgi:hypothetical protein